MFEFFLLTIMDYNGFKLDFHRIKIRYKNRMHANQFSVKETRKSELFKSLDISLNLISISC